MAGHVYLVQPLIALIAGILILIVPRLLNYVVALYLIIIGIVGLFGCLHHSGRLSRTRLIQGLDLRG